MNINIAALLALGESVHKLSKSMKNACYESEHDCEFDFAQDYWFDDVDCINVRPDGTRIDNCPALLIDDPLKSLLIEKGIHDRHNAFECGEELTSELRELLNADVYPTAHTYDELIDELVEAFNSEAQKGHHARSNLLNDANDCIYEMKSCNSIEKAYEAFLRYKSALLNHANSFERLHRIRSVLCSMCIDKFENYFQYSNEYVKGSRKYIGDGYHRILRSYVDRIDRNFQYCLGIRSISVEVERNNDDTHDPVTNSDERFDNW